MDAVSRYLLSKAGFSAVKPPLHLTLAQWSRVPDAAYTERLLPRLWTVAQDDPGMAVGVLGELQAAMTGCVGTGMMLLHHLNLLLDGLEDEGIDCTVLKGASLAQRLYGDPLARQWNDIDLLIHPGDRDRALQVLTSHLGCRIDHSFIHDLDHHYSLFRPAGPSEVHIELHVGLFLGSGVQFPEDWWESRVRSQIGPRLGSSLRDDHLLVFLCIHAAVHGYASWGWLVDIKDLLSKSQVSPEMVIQAAQGINRAAGVYHTLSLIKSMGVPVPDQILAGLRPLRDLTPLIRFLVFRGPRSSLGFCRLIAFLAIREAGREPWTGWFFPPYSDFRRRYPKRSNVVAAFLYFPWILLSVGRAVFAIMKSYLRLRHN